MLRSDPWPATTAGPPAVASAYAPPSAPAVAPRPDGVAPAPGPRGHAVDRAAALAIRAVVVLGATVAVAPAIPLAVRSAALALAFAAALVAVVAAAALGLRAALGRAGSAFERATTGLAVAGIGAAVLLAVQLEVVRLAAGRPALTWIVDWRWALNHAWAIARSGGVERALDYAGAGLDYHVGPAWVAGALERLLGVSPAVTLFGLVPPLCVLGMVVAALALLAGAGMPRRLAALAVAVTLTFPLPQLGPVEALYALPGDLRQPTTWPNLPVALMLNALLALAVALASLALLLDRRARAGALALGAVGLAAVVQIKPQYFVGFGLVVGLIGLARAAGLADPGRHRWGLLAAAAAALVLALLQLALLPGDLPVLAAPRWAPGVTWAGFTELRATGMLLAAAAVGAWAVARRATVADGSARALLGPLLASAGAIAALSAALYLLDFPLRDEVLRRAAAAELNDVSSTYLERDLAQAFLAPRLLLLLHATALLGTVVARRRWRAALVPAAAAVVASPLLLLAAGFTTPGDRAAVAEDAPLRRVLAAIPRDGTLLVASDLADPAQDHRRPLRGVLLTAYHGHAAYVSNVRYVHYARPDAPQRLAAVRAFFGTPWSPWHGGWLSGTGITHVLVSDRCVPPWHGDAALPLREVARDGGWTAYAVRPDGRAETAGAAMPEPRDVSPAHGRSECLLGRHRP